MTELSSIIDKFGVYSYKSPLIYFKLENLDDWKHRELGILKDPIMNAYICKLDEEIFTDNPIIEPDILSEGNILNEWIEEDWLGLFKELCDMARTHRFCIVRLYTKEPYWRVFTPRHITKITYDKYDNPATVVVEWQHLLPFAEKPTEHKETITLNRDGKESTEQADGLFVAFQRGKGKQLGVCDLESIWDLIIYIRYQLLDIINNSAKTSGFFHFVYGSALKDSQKQDLINAIDYTGIGQAIGAKKTVLEEINFHYPEHPEFTVDAINESLNILSGVARLPVSFFKGEKEGGGVFQEGFSDEAKITKKKKYIFGQFRKYFIRLIKMRWGKIITNIEPYLEKELEQDEEFEQTAENQFKKDNLKDKDKKKVNINKNSIRSNV